MKHRSLMMCRRVESSFYLGVDVCLRPLRICYAGDNWRSSDAKFCLITFCGTVDSCGEIVVYVVYAVSCVRITILLSIEYCCCCCSVFLLIL
jgi:hypothetical protein